MNRPTEEEQQQVVLVLWENLIGLPSARYTPNTFKVLKRFRCYRHALDLYETNALAVRALWDLWGQDIAVGIVTYLGHEFVPGLRERLDRDGIVRISTMSTKPPEVARMLSLNEHMIRMVDPDTSRCLTYGPKGQIVSAANALQIGRIC